MRILIVEDNPDTGATLGMILRALGHEIRHEQDGESALDIVPDFQPHVVVMDLGLPGISGHEAAELIRDLDLDPDPMIVALSAWRRDEDRQRSKDAGIDHHLVKPLDLQVLNDVLRLHPEFDSGL